MKMKIERLTRERDRLAAEIDALKHRLRGFDDAINLLKQEEESNASLTTRKRPNVKGMTLKVLEESGEKGATAQEVVTKAQERGHNLDRASVSSLLSRLKRENTLVFVDSRYYLASHAPTEGSENDHLNIPSLRPPLNVVRSGE